MDFFEAFRAAVNPTGRRATWLPWEFVDYWASFVEHVELGYSSGLYEYENELSVRDNLESALSDPRLFGYQSWRALVAEIDSVDARMRAVLANGPLVRPQEPWWRKRLPGFAESEMVEDVKDMFGIDIQST